jgi:DnaJ-class molecular chaperone
MKCKECNGTGKAKGSAWEMKDNDVRYWKVDCGLCKGRGEIELKRCPFCHGEAFYAFDELEKHEPHHIECEVCEASIYGESFSEVVTKWQSRHDAQRKLI